MNMAFPKWVDQQRAGRPQAAYTDELVEVRATALYRVLYLMENGGKREDRQQVAATLRDWLNLTAITTTTPGETV